MIRQLVDQYGWENCIVKYDALLGWEVSAIGCNCEYVVSQALAFAIIRTLQKLALPAPQLP